MQTLKEICLSALINSQSFNNRPIDLLNALIPEELKEELVKQHQLKEILTKKLISLSSEELCGIGCQNQHIGLFILNTPELYEKLGRHEKYSWRDRSICNRHSENYLFDLANSRLETAVQVMQTYDLKSRLAPFQQRHLQQKIDQFLTEHTSIPLDSSKP